MRNPGIRGFGVPRLLAQLEIEYKDGTKELVVTDTTWQAAARGPIVANNEFDGEEYNAFNELPGWNKTGYETNYKWMAAQIARTGRQVGGTAQREYPYHGGDQTRGDHGAAQR